MAARRSLFTGVVAALALLGLVLVGCESDGNGGGEDDTSGGTTDTVTETDTTGEPDVVGGDDTGGGEDDVPCVPSCEGRECGDDGCGGQCGTGCGAGATCISGTCCAPSCEGRDCGSDGCGGTCGSCGLGQTCDVDTGVCGVGSGLSCPAYFVCAAACPAGDDGCLAGCLAATEAAAATVAEALAGCFEASCPECGDEACRRTCGADNCGQDYTDCFVGDAQCGDVYTCVNACIREQAYGTAFFDACRADCLAIGTPQAQQDYLDLEICVLQEGDCDPGDSADWEGCEARAQHTTCSAQSADCPQG